MKWTMTLKYVLVELCKVGLFPKLSLSNPYKKNKHSVAETLKNVQ